MYLTGGPCHGDLIGDDVGPLTHIAGSALSFAVAANGGAEKLCAPPHARQRAARA